MKIANYLLATMLVGASGTAATGVTTRTTGPAATSNGQKVLFEIQSLAANLVKIIEGNLFRF